MLTSLRKKWNLRTYALKQKSAAKKAAQALGKELLEMGPESLLVGAYTSRAAKRWAKYAAWSEVSAYAEAGATVEEVINQVGRASLTPTRVSDAEFLMAWMWEQEVNCERRIIVDYLINEIEGQGG